MLGSGVGGHQRTIGRERQRPGRRRDAVQEVIDQAIAVLGEHRLGMELHAVDRMLAVLDGHDLAVLRRGRHLQLGGTEAGAMTSEW